ncbi:hypothetical protein D3C79_744850 [compost metagenome]
MHYQLAFSVSQPFALGIDLLLCGLLAQLPFGGVEFLPDLGDLLLLFGELALGNGLAQAGIKAIDALFCLSDALALAINGDIVSLAGYLAGYGIQSLMHFGDRCVQLISHCIDGIHRNAARLGIDNEHRVAERVKITFVLIQLGIEAILHQTNFDARVS